jgi:hypothetical protein
MDYNYFYLARRNPSIKPEDWHRMWRSHSEFAGQFPMIRSNPKRVQYCARIRAPRIDGKPFDPPGHHDYDGAARITARSADVRPNLPPEVRTVIDADELRVFDIHVRHRSFRGQEILVAGSNPGGEPGPAAVLRFLARRPGISRSGFFEHFSGAHAELATRALGDAKSVLRYVHDQIAEDAPPACPFDAVSESWFGSVDDATRSLVDPALAPLADDLASFCDMQKSVTLLTEVIMRREP